ncbi:MAG: hypothetical protein LAT67_07540 [Balneolales bacterium]|nr:hypothetical protein [Balneolales bacterium]
MKFENPTPSQQTIARTFSYTTTAFLVGSMIYLFLNQLIIVTAQPDWVGTAVLIAFGLIYGNITYLLTRRYNRRPHTYNWFTNLIGPLFLSPTILLIQIKGDIFPTLIDSLFFHGIIFAAMLIGTIRGRKKGRQMLADMLERQKFESAKEVADSP